MSKKSLAVIVGAATLFATPAMAGPDGAFSGPFIGGEAGFQRNKVELTAPGNVALKDRDKGFNLRGLAGYDVTMGDSLVLGVELGLGRGGPEVDHTQGTASFKADPGLMLDASARAGILATPSTLLYGRVGYANSKIDITATNTDITDGTFTRDKRKGGLMFGAGAEFAVTDGLRLRTEYRRSKTGDLKSDQALIGVILSF